MAPFVTGDVNVAALEDLVRLCAELGRLRQRGTAARRPARAPAPPGKRSSEAIIGKAVDLLSGPGGLASFLRRRQLGVPAWAGRACRWTSGTPVGPGRIRNAVILRDRHVPVGRAVRPARHRLRGASH